MNSIRAKLAQDHEALDSLLRCLAQDAQAPCRGSLETTWNAFEGRLLRHMDAEESFLLPLVEASHPAEVERTLAEHRQIRDLVAQLGLAIELHTARQPQVLELIRMLGKHAAHEDETLYQLAGDKASTTVARSLFKGLKTAIRSAGPSGPRDARARP